MDTGGGVAAAPSAFNTGGSAPGPVLLYIAHYDPQTGSMQHPTARSTGKLTVAAPKSWQDLVFKAAT